MNKQIYFLWEYNWYAGTIVSEGPKNIKVDVNIPGFKSHTRSVSKEKCAYPDEKVCVVWETWKGKNGAGGYRVERELYPQNRYPASQVSRQSIGLGRVTEKEYGVLHDQFGSIQLQ